MQVIAGILTFTLITGYPGSRLQVAGRFDLLIALSRRGEPDAPLGCVGDAVRCYPFEPA